MTDHYNDFPFEEIRLPSGDYFNSMAEARGYGHDQNQIWSVVEGEDTWTYGPAHHYINVIGFVATIERHDEDTYYHEKP